MNDFADVDFDLFVSYATADEHFVSQIVSILREDPALSVWHDKDRIDVFDEIPARLADGLGRCRLVLAFLSDAYLDSPTCQWELLSALRAGGAHPGARLVTVAVDDHSAAADWPILGELRHGPAATEGERTRIKAQLSDRVRGLEPLGSLPPAAPHWGPAPDLSRTFAGRLRELLSLHSGLTGHTDATKGLGSSSRSTVVVDGLAGIGKSILAAQYAQSFNSAYPGGVVHLNAGADELGHRVQDSIVVLDYVLPQIQTWLLEQQADVVEAQGGSAWLTDPIPARGWARARSVVASADAGRILWIVDDVPEGLDANARTLLTNPAANSATLVTTRSATYRHIWGAPLTLSWMRPEDSRRLLSLQSASRDIQALDDLADLAHHHPLTLAILGSRLRDESPQAVASDLRRRMTDQDDLDAKWVDVVEETGRAYGALPMDHRPSLVAAVHGSLDAVSRTASAAGAALTIACARMFPAGAWLPRPLLDAVSRNAGGPSSLGGIAALSAQNLLSASDSSISLHGLVRDAVVAIGEPSGPYGDALRAIDEARVRLTAVEWYYQLADERSDDAYAMDPVWRSLWTLLSKVDLTALPLDARLKAADTLRSLGRKIVRHPDMNLAPDEQLAVLSEACEWAKRSIELIPDSGDAAKLSRAKSEAMLGDLVCQQAEATRLLGRTEEALDLVNSAKALLQRSYDVRLSMYGGDRSEPVVLLGRFNQGRLGPALAKILHGKPEVRSWLKDAEEAYLEVLTARALRLQAARDGEYLVDGRRATDKDINTLMAETAAAAAGIGLTKYYAAVSDPTLSPVERRASLITAEGRVRESLEIRTDLPPTDGDHLDVGKSWQLLAKIMLARMTLLERENRHAASAKATVREWNEEEAWLQTLVT